MSVKKKLDINHPDCSKYKERFDAIWKAYSELEKKERSKYPNWQGRDHPADAVLRPAHRKMCEEIKALQKEYAYLFTEDPDE